MAAKKVALKIKKPVVKKAAPVRAPARKLPARPPRAVAKPVVPKKAKAKVPVVGPEGSNLYRGLRKYTVPKLKMLLEGRDPAETAVKFVRYIASLESQMPDWKAKRLPPPDGKPRKRGRPSKADIAAREGKVTPAKPTKAADVVAKAKAGSIVPPPRFQAPKPVAPAKPAFRVPAVAPVPPKPLFRLPGTK